MMLEKRINFLLFCCVEIFLNFYFVVGKMINKLSVTLRLLNEVHAIFGIVFMDDF